MTEKEALFNYCLRLADNALILSYRLSEWSSNAPLLEEDLALTNFALDDLGRAQLLLKYAAETESNGRTEDDLAYKRGERKFLNNILAEIPNGDFAQTIARQLFISVFEYYFFTELQKSADTTLAGIAAKTLKEVKYHLAHAEDWTVRLGDGTIESRGRMQKAINYLWMYTGELFEIDDTEKLLTKNAIAVNTPLLKKDWFQHISRVLVEATLHVPQDGYMQTGGRNGIHSEHLGHILCEMQYLQRAYPDAIW